MAHSIFHMAVGVSIGTVALLPQVAHHLARRRPLARPIAALLLWAYGLGALAVTPNLLRHLGVPDPILTGPWMNVFVLHPLIDRHYEGGLLVGQLTVAALFIAHYVLILGALAVAHRRHLR